jgi:hypothetical protein
VRAGTRRYGALEQAGGLDEPDVTSFRQRRFSSGLPTSAVRDAVRHHASYLAFPRIPDMPYSQQVIVRSALLLPPSPARPQGTPQTPSLTRSLVSGFQTEATSGVL